MLTLNAAHTPDLVFIYFTDGSARFDVKIINLHTTESLPSCHVEKKYNNPRHWIAEHLFDICCETICFRSVFPQLPLPPTPSEVFDIFSSCFPSLVERILVLFHVFVNRHVHCKRKETNHGYCRTFSKLHTTLGGVHYQHKCIYFAYTDISNAGTL